MHLSPSQIKDIIIGVLVAYVVIDLLLAYATRARHPGLFATLQSAMSDENVGVVVLIGLGVGFLAYYLSSRARELFVTKKSHSE
jgi:ABC-type antimicrobial peptide transport system permease subunit